MAAKRLWIGIDGGGIEWRYDPTGVPHHNVEIVSFNVPLVSAVRAICRIPRFTGQTGYSVGEHSVVLARRIRESPLPAHLIRLGVRWALAHDLAEGLGINDINRDIKAHLGGEIKSLERQFSEMIWCQHFNEPDLTWSEKDLVQQVVHDYDQELGNQEAVHFKMAPPWFQPLPEVEGPEQPFEPENWDPVVAVAEWWKEWGS